MIPARARPRPGREGSRFVLPRETTPRMTPGTASTGTSAEQRPSTSEAVAIPFRASDAPSVVLGASDGGRSTSTVATTRAGGTNVGSYSDGSKRGRLIAPRTGAHGGQGWASSFTPQRCLGQPTR
jgi:hypothetical protein